MNAQTIVIVLLMIILTAMLFWYQLDKKQLDRKHKSNIMELQNALSLNRSQISIRKEGLSRYDFLKYNLNESLVVQSEIPLGI